jgi:hypothetical protein
VDAHNKVIRVFEDLARRNVSKAGFGLEVAMVVPFHLSDGVLALPIVLDLVFLGEWKLEG